ncbi:MAG: hypothetical protein AAF591_19105 [Verrucomicrobiota bacterium]
MTQRNLFLAVVMMAAMWVWALPEVWAQGEKSGAPAKKAKGNAVVIPEVERDEVICFALYTVQDEILKMTAVLYPLEEGEAREVRLEVEETPGEWIEIATAEVNEEGWTALFRVEEWDHARDWPYRVRHGEAATYEGLVRRDPVDKEEIVVAGFTGNSNRDRGQREDMIANLKAQDPDLLFFSGDQSYDHTSHTAAWLLFGRQFGEIIKDRPTVSIPDDHDVGQGNLWGQSGIVSTLKGGADGGYVMPPEYVNMVQRAQAGNLPDPYDPTPVEQGITVYYTSLNVGGIDFAIIEDRKFKTGPAGLIPRQGPRPDHINDPGYDRATVDVPEAILLGDRQLEFLHAWGQDWDGADMKCVLSQTIFAGGAHLHGKLGGRLLADLDSNGWPQSGRARAWEEMRRCFAFHLAGDQHLATVIHHGLNSWEDSGYSFCVPSIVNYYGRWWWPLEDPQEGGPETTMEFAGRFYDGLGNKVTMEAYANPTEDNFKAAGHGLVRFNKKTREITMECWPRFVDVTDASAEQFEGWPITISQADNYNREAIAHLPELEFAGEERPVVQVVKDDTGEVVYTVRAWGERLRPKVFQEGKYTVLVDGKVVQDGVVAEPVEVATD